MLVPIIIPTGYTYSCTVSGTTFKIVQCEHCRFVYVYKMTRTGAGSISVSLLGDDSHAAHNAQKVASYELTQKLSEDCDAVPCLECGKYQQHMIDALKRYSSASVQYFCRMAVISGLVIVGLSGVMWLAQSRDPAMSPIGFVGMVLGAVVTGAGFLIGRIHKSKDFDPNSTDLAERMKTARTYARSLDEFQQMLEGTGIKFQLPAPPTA